jgi:hypothetical protein
MRDMLIYLLGPFLALLPTRWRKALPFYQSVPWHAAAILSGLAESVVALTALLFWYSVSVTSWVSRGLDSVLSKSPPMDITEHEVGFAALLIWAMHPLTWTIAFFAIEGVARLCASFTDTVLGVFPLYLVEKIYSKICRRGPPEPSGAAKFSQSNVSSYIDTVKEKILAARLTQVPDELCLGKDGDDEFLEIRTWQAQPDWTPPRIIRYEDGYYRLEECSRSSAPRPYIYKLRKLPKGVPGRTVLTYSPDEQPVIASV